MALTPDDEVTAAELAIGLLEGEERVDALRRTLAEPQFAAAVERWRARFADWYADYPEVDPPEWMARRVAALAGGAAQARSWRWATAAVSLLAACLAVALVLRPADMPAPPPGPTVVAPVTFAAAMTPTDAKGQAAFAALFDTRLGQVRVPAGISVPSGRVAELWRIGGDGVPHSLGLLRREGTTAIRLSAADRGALAAGATLAISIEPEGGSPKPVPSGPVVAIGPLTRI